jgi:hypothetical protein
MRKITIIEQVSLEGIIQAPSGLEEEPGYPTADGLRDLTGLCAPAPWASRREPT